MPCSGEISSLFSKTTLSETTRNGVKGGLFTGKGDYASKSIFIPYVGYADGSKLVSPVFSTSAAESSVNYVGSVFSAYLSWVKDDSYAMYRVYINQSSFYNETYYVYLRQRSTPVYYGIQIRPVIGANE